MFKSVWLPIAAAHATFTVEISLSLWNCINAYKRRPQADEQPPWTLRVRYRRLFLISGFLASFLGILVSSVFVTLSWVQGGRWINHLLHTIPLWSIVQEVSMVSATIIRTPSSADQIGDIACGWKL